MIIKTNVVVAILTNDYTIKVYSHGDYRTSITELFLETHDPKTGYKRAQRAVRIINWRITCDDAKDLWEAVYGRPFQGHAVWAAIEAK